MTSNRPGGPGAVAGAAGLAIAALLSGCSGSDAGGDEPSVAATSAPATTSSPTTASPTASAGSSNPTAPPVRVARTIASGLEVPWGVTFLPDGSALVAERDSGRILAVPANGGRATPVGTVPGVQAVGEGGLLGLATPRASAGSPVAVYAYLTSEHDDNRVVVMSYQGGRLGAPRTILSGIPAAGRHNGGRMTFGPDGKLYIGTGDAGNDSLAQQRSNLGGKVLRLEPNGSVPADNPFARSPVWSWGHRNVQGLAFDGNGLLWATEFGQNTWDELNQITKGGNYGWPEVEGREQREGFIDPQVQWRTSDASPSGLAIVDDVAYVAALRGERLWQVPLVGGRAAEPVARLRGEYGRIRTVEPAPGGGLWFATSNRDGRGDPAREDDRVLLLDLG